MLYQGSQLIKGTQVTRFDCKHLSSQSHLISQRPESHDVVSKSRGDLPGKYLYIYKRKDCVVRSAVHSTIFTTAYYGQDAGPGRPSPCRDLKPYRIQGSTLEPCPSSLSLFKQSLTVPARMASGKDSPASPLGHRDYRCLLLRYQLKRFSFVVFFFLF